MILIQGFGRVLATLAVALMVMVTVVDVAEARRAGSGFGSRGTRTFSTPSTTRTAPTDAQPIDRTMTRQQSAQPSAGRNQTATNPRPGLFGGLGGSLIGGLMLGGLVGMLLGQGLGGGIGFLGLILQVLLIAGAFVFLRRMFAQKNAPAYAGNAQARNAYQNGAQDFEIPRIGGGNRQAAAQPTAVQPKGGDEIGVTQADLEQFEGLLKELQAAYAAEDFRTLRQITTPEAMSYLAEELSDNATRGLKNEVRDIHLVQGDVAEAWRESADDYATVAMRYESIDVMRDRATNRIVSGDPDNLTEAVEIWTFVRRDGGEWKVSAIQGVQNA